MSRYVPRAVQALYCLCTHHRDVHRKGGGCDATAGTGGVCSCERFDSRVPAPRPAPDYHKKTPCKWTP